MLCTCRINHEEAICTSRNIACTDRDSKERGAGAETTSRGRREPELRSRRARHEHNGFARSITVGLLKAAASGCHAAHTGGRVILLFLGNVERSSMLGSNSHTRAAVLLLPETGRLLAGADWARLRHVEAHNLGGTGAAGCRRLSGCGASQERGRWRSRGGSAATGSKVAGVASSERRPACRSRATATVEMMPRGGLTCS